MPGQTRAILRRVNSVKSTRKITRAMEMVSSAKLKNAQKKATQLHQYAERLEGLLRGALAHKVAAHHPLLKTRPVQKTAILLVTSDKGLCGAYNSNVIKEGLRVWAEDAESSGGFLPIGNKGRAALRRRNVPLYRELCVEGGKPSFSDAQNATEAVVQLYQKGTVDRVLLVYTEFASALTQRPKVLHLLPFTEVSAGAALDRGLMWDPGPSEVLSRLIPEYLGTMVYRALLDSTASEFAARRIAMKAATDNASEMIDKLTLQYNQARQAAITQEIAEIVGGAEALE